MNPTGVIRHDTFHEHLQRFADHSLIVLHRQSAFQSGQFLNAFLAHFSRHLIRIIRSGSPPSLAVREDVNLHKAGSSTGIERLRKLGIRLTGKPDNHVGCESHLRHDLPNTIELLQKPPHAVPPAHPRQHAV